MNTHIIIINNIYHPPAPDYDPINPPRTVSKSRFSYDEVHPDAEEIIERLKQAESEGQVRVIIFDWFGKYFGADIIGEEWDTLQDGVLDLWRYCTK